MSQKGLFWTRQMLVGDLDKLSIYLQVAGVSALHVPSIDWLGESYTNSVSVALSRGLQGTRQILK